MNNDRRTSVAAGFAAAAFGYDRYASVQAIVAAMVADRVAALVDGNSPEILEVGCGTGILTQRIAALLPRAQIIASDLCPAMVARAREGGPAGVRFLPYDVEGAAVPTELASRKFNVILSSLAAQWFVDLPAALARLARLLSPRGVMIIATVADGSFAEWRKAHADCDLPCGLRSFVTEQALADALGEYGRTQIESVDIPLSIRGARGLLRHFRGLGAHVPRAGHVPLNGGDLRRVMAAYDARGGATSYRVLIGTVQT